MSDNHFVHEKTQRMVSCIMRKLGRHQFRRSELALTHLVFDVPGLDPAFDGYKIVHITDIHFGHWVSPERLDGIVGVINEQQPDLVVNTGDFVSYVIEELADDMIAAFQEIKATDGSLAVLGNHDHWLDLDQIRYILRAGHVIELPNDVYTIDRDDAQLHVAGVDSISLGADRLDEVLKKMPPSGPALMLAHEPDFADQTAATGRFFLQLSGHSHGTQIIPPGMGPVLRGENFKKYPKGLYQVGNMAQYTSNGVGTHALRLRINCPPEIVVIVLRSQTSEE
ncbi:MAG: metallophosphoesterase [Candidatus Promineifilaceae bacterium]|nr:metallophosphoesterase [Candidatus Promineifilaceae bacterium]